MLSRTIILVVIIFSVLKCSNENDTSAVSTEAPSRISLHQEADKMTVVDTVINITEAYMRQTLTNETEADVAEIILKFETCRLGLDALKKGIKVGKGNEIFTYDTAYRIAESEITGFAVSYWLGPSDLNGNCFRPTTALLIEKPNGIRAVKLHFVPTNRSIDSVVRSTIYGFDYECGGRGKIRDFKISLK